LEAVATIISAPAGLREAITLKALRNQRFDLAGWPFSDHPGLEPHSPALTGGAFSLERAMKIGKGSGWAIRSSQSPNLPKQEIPCARVSKKKLLNAPSMTAPSPRS
jgi:hypothetical protein